MSAPAPAGSIDELPARMLDAALQGDAAQYHALALRWLQTLPWAWLLASTLICGLVGAWLGRGHGRIGAGLLWGVLLGPLGWPLAVRPRRPPPLPPR